MCRVLMYRGGPVLVDHLLYQSDNSLIKQTHSARMLAMLNLAGFGMVAWDRASHRPEDPFRYHSPYVPLFDRNLKTLAEKLTASTVIAHVRGVPYHEKVTVGEQNTHPFHFAGTRLYLAHNGDLADFARMRFALLPHVKPAIAQEIRGNTDSEWICALLVSRFDDPAAPHGHDELIDAIQRTLEIIRDVRKAHGIGTCSPTNLFVSDGDHLVAVRYAFDFGRYDPAEPETARESTHRFLSLWYTMGRDYGFHDGEWKMVGGAREPDSIVIASEPLTRDTSTWLEVPEYSACCVEETAGRLRFRVRYLE